jgi:hypothetical protein
MSRLCISAMCLKFFQAELSIPIFAIRQYFIFRIFAVSANTKEVREDE